MHTHVHAHSQIYTHIATCSHKAGTSTLSHLHSHTQPHEHTHLLDCVVYCWVLQRAQLWINAVTHIPTWQEGEVQNKVPFSNPADLWGHPKSAQIYILYHLIPLSSRLPAQLLSTVARDLGFLLSTSCLILPTPG